MGIKWTTLVKFFCKLALNCSVNMRFSVRTRRKKVLKVWKVCPLGEIFGTIFKNKVEVILHLSLF